MYCRNCGSSIPDGAKFCGHCGAMAEAIPPVPKKNKLPIILISCLVVVLILFVALFLFLKSGILVSTNLSGSFSTAPGTNSENTESANISLITSNADAYPEISLYFKVVDDSGNPIGSLKKGSFKIREYLDINDYIERDVIYASNSDKSNLNVSLAIDRSSSISKDSMKSIKDVTNAFLSKLDFESGDKADIVAFETTVMQMCMFTNNENLLVNGMNSLYPRGSTACYDAIIKSINNASIQNGRRCVIVFSDGEDYSSKNKINDVISLANAKSVPVYTIGVGSGIYLDDLKRIAESTGGTYHHIDDFSAIEDMGGIYDDIYEDQENLYHVKYISDSSVAQNAERRIVVSLNGEGYSGECDRTYTPVIPVKVAPHTSRYEIIKSDATWEEANRLCIEKGGHLATITDAAEQQTIINFAEARLGDDFIGKLWIGGYTTNDENNQGMGHWVTGEPFSYENWFVNSEGKREPSRFDGNDQESEFYLMLWKIGNNWSWNDQRNDLANSPFSKDYKGKMGYIIEYEE